MRDPFVRKCLAFGAGALALFVAVSAVLAGEASAPEAVATTTGSLAETLFPIAPAGACLALIFAFVFYKKMMSAETYGEADADAGQPAPAPIPKAAKQTRKR